MCCLKVNQVTTKHYKSSQFQLLLSTSSSLQQPSTTFEVYISLLYNSSAHQRRVMSARQQVIVLYLGVMVPSVYSLPVVAIEVWVLVYWPEEDSTTVVQEDLLKGKGC